MIWGTFGHITIYIMVQYFYKAHDMNLITFRLTAMTKFETYYFSFFGCPIKALVYEKLKRNLYVFNRFLYFSYIKIFLKVIH